MWVFVRGSFGLRQLPSTLPHAALRTCQQLGAWNAQVWRRSHAPRGHLRNNFAVARESERRFAGTSICA